MSKEKITTDWLMGDLFENCPEAAQVLKKYFGDGCLTCPGAKLETLAFGSTMHGVDAGVIVDEINELIEAR